MPKTGKNDEKTLLFAKIFGKLNKNGYICNKNVLILCSNFFLRNVIYCRFLTNGSCIAISFREWMTAHVKWKIPWITCYRCRGMEWSGLYLPRTILLLAI